MNHDSALELIEDLHHGSLNESVQRTLLTHIDCCEECQALSGTYRMLTGAFDTRDDHPSNDAIVHYALAPEILDEAKRNRVASHLGACVTCRLEVDATREAEEELGGKPSVQTEVAGGSPAGFPYLKTGLAAAVVVAALGYPAYLGLFQLPRLEEEIARLDTAPLPYEIGGTTWAGLVETIVLQAPLRSGNDEVLSVEIGDAPYFVLAVDLSANEAEDTAGVLRLAIRDADGRSVWSQKLPRTDTDRQIDASGAISVLVPSGVLPRGRLTTNLLRQVDSGEESVFEADFQVVPGSAESTSSSPRR